jgi:hypothetical protein
VSDISLHAGPTNPQRGLHTRGTRPGGWGLLCPCSSAQLEDRADGDGAGTRRGRARTVWQAQISPHGSNEAAAVAWVRATRTRFITFYWDDGRLFVWVGATPPPLHVWGDPVRTATVHSGPHVGGGGGGRWLLDHGSAPGPDRPARNRWPARLREAADEPPGLMAHLERDTSSSSDGPMPRLELEGTSSTDGGAATRCPSPGSTESANLDDPQDSDRGNAVSAMAGVD